MSEKLTYEEFKAKYMADIPKETIDQLEKLHDIEELEKIIEEDAQEQYNKYLRGY